ncbi:Macrophage colony-stimulating factor 1 receptor, partial [Basidiobolus ranarum]
EQAERLAQEYARVSTVVECSELYFNYYADVPGPVPYQSRLEIDPSEIDIGNGGPPPQYGIHLIFKQGIVHYGPWTDQQRSSMQNYFFPNSYRDLEKTNPLQYGLPRVHTELKMFIQLDKDITIRVPFRESSKNWKYTAANNGAYYGARSPRPYGWIDFKSSGFYIDLSVPLVVGENGYATMVDVRCQDLEIATSTNYAAMLQSQSFHIHCVLQNPLIWNQIRTWVFDLNFEKTKLYLLRDQVTLMQDMIKDWTAGPSVDFVHFVPIEYIYKMIFNELEINLYVNEHNIINDPSDLDDNAILSLSMSRLDAAIITPFGKFEPKTNNIEFSVNVQKISASLSLPTSHTASAFLPKKTQNIGAIKGFVIDGNYEYYTKIDPTHLDTLTMNLKAVKPNLQISGLLVKYVMIVKDNYLGAFNNFVTFEEYRSRIDSSYDRVEQVNAQHRAKNPENPYEVFIRLLVEDVILKLPENLYACEDFLEVYIQELQVENRATDFYQDLYATTSPVFLTKGEPGAVALSKQKISRIYKDRQKCWR